MTWAANASLISTRSTSSMVMPARASACCDASTGPRPMISGDSAVTPVETIRASGVMPELAGLGVAHDDDRGGAVVERAAVAGGDPAVRAEHRLERRPPPPASRRGGGRRRSTTTVPSGVVTGVISRAQKPFAMAFSARFCDRTPNSSMSSRVTPLICGEVLGGLAHREVDVGQLRRPRAGRATVGAALGRAASVRACASANLGFCQPPPTSACASGGRPSELPRAYRDTISTPAEMNTSPSPALIAWNAIRVVCSDEAQYRVSGRAGQVVVARAGWRPRGPC